MSYDTHKTWFYQLVGRDIHLWQYVESNATDTLAGIRISLPDEYYGKLHGVQPYAKHDQLEVVRGISPHLAPHCCMNAFKRMPRWMKRKLEERDRERRWTSSR